MQQANSRNHRSRGKNDGQNVLYADGHVDWMATPYAGIKRKLDPAQAATPWRDQIYRAEPDAAEGAGYVYNTANTRPAKDRDSILMPARDSN
jgi:prepilin-type processing-associated H-X9-DG protein